MIYTEEDLLPLSALQHLLFCERQCALIHIERLWTENRFTAEGRIMHERVHTAGQASRGKVRYEYGVALRSLRLGVTGQADVVEFHKQQGAGAACFAWRPFPVEYKRGKAKKENWDKVQLCAQALCLEEMLGVPVPDGALFYGKTKRRLDVCFDNLLRRETENCSDRLHVLIDAGRTPAPVYSGKCDACSFLDTCLPKAMGGKKSATRYLRAAIGDL